MLRRASRFAFARATVGGGRAWVGISVVLGVMRLMGRLARREAEVVYCEELQPGGRLVVTHLPGPKR